MRTFFDGYTDIVYAFKLIVTHTLDDVEPIISRLGKFHIPAVRVMNKEQVAPATANPLTVFIGQIAVNGIANGFTFGRCNIDEQPYVTVGIVRLIPDINEYVVIGIYIIDRS